MSVSKKIEERKKKRLQLLHAIYELTGADRNKLVPIFILGRSLGFNNETIEEIRQYLQEEGLIGEKFSPHFGRFEQKGKVVSFRFVYTPAEERDRLIYSITHEGVIEVEKALSEPETPTKYFPPLKNIKINIEKIEDSQILIDSPYATQIKTSEKEFFKKLKELSEFIKQEIEQLKLKDKDKQELEAEIQTIDAQLSSSKPKIRILKECIPTIRRIIEGAAGSIIASQILDKLPAIEKILQNIF